MRPFDFAQGRHPTGFAETRFRPSPGSLTYESPVLQHWENREFSGPVAACGEGMEYKHGHVPFLRPRCGLRDSLFDDHLPTVKRVGFDIPSLPERVFLPKHPLPVDRDPGLSQTASCGLLEGPLCMMLRLLRNVMGHDLLLRLAYTEHADPSCHANFFPRWFYSASSCP